MIQIDENYKKKVIAAITEARANFSSTDAAFSKKLGINNAVYSRIKGGEIDNILKESQWLNIGRELGVDLNERKWNIAHTDVFAIIKEEVEFCKAFSKARIFVDECGIGKTFTAKYLSRTLKNCFYVDASQAKTKQQFVRLLARVIGVDDKGKYASVKEGIKYFLKVLPSPVIIVDEAGDLAYDAFLEIKEFWNATEGLCGWYLVGAEGLRAKIERGISHKKVGYREIFSRFSEKYSTAVPAERTQRIQFYTKLITDVLSVNAQDKLVVNLIVKKCLVQVDGNIGGLRRAESLLILNS
jgi:hypothetical protein